VEAVDLVDKEPFWMFVRMPARSPAFSICGPEVVWSCVPAARAMRLAKVVLPKPGGPDSRTWSSTSERCFAASSMSRMRSLTFSWPMNSENAGGRRETSNGVAGAVVVVW
jgi:hypothetical protein